MTENIKNRVEWIKGILERSGAAGIVIGNSGGKDCTLVEILCKKATEHVLSVIMPCESSLNYTTDKEHARLAAEKFCIETVEVDLTRTKLSIKSALEPVTGDAKTAFTNINPRLRMTALYAIAQARGYLVAGTGNAAERYTGYFTKWGDGAYDFNPIADMSVSDVYETLKFLDCPTEIIDKAPSAGLYEGQTDEKEMGVSYDEIERHMKGVETPNRERINALHNSTAHKRKLPPMYGKSE